MLVVYQRFADRVRKALDSAAISRELRPHFRKWLRFYFDLCSKYRHSPRSKSSLLLFMAKLARYSSRTFWSRRRPYREESTTSLCNPAMDARTACAGSGCDLRLHTQCRRTVCNLRNHHDEIRFPRILTSAGNGCRLRVLTIIDVIKSCH
jgi:hypothetical protein